MLRWILGVTLRIRKEVRISVMNLEWLVSIIRYVKLGYGGMDTWNGERETAVGYKTHYEG